MTQIVNTFSGTDFSSLTPVILTDVSGNYVAYSGSGGGTGDIVGPATATDNAIVRFDTTTGKLVQNSTWILDDSGNATANPLSISTGGAFTSTKLNMINDQTSLAGQSLLSLGTASGTNISLKDDSTITMAGDLTATGLNGSALTLIGANANLSTPNGAASVHASGQASLISDFSSISVTGKTNVSINAGYAGGSGNIYLNSNSTGLIIPDVSMIPVASGNISLGSPSLPFSGVYANNLNAPTISGNVVIATDYWATAPTYAFMQSSGNMTSKQTPGTATTYAVVSGLSYVNCLSGSNFTMNLSDSNHRITYVGSRPIVAHALGTVGLFWNVNNTFRLAICKNGDLTIGNAVADIYSNGAVGDMNWSVQAILPMVSGDYLQLGTRNNSGAAAQGGYGWQFSVAKIL